MRNTSYRGGVRNALGSCPGVGGLRNALRVRLRDHRGGPSESQASSNGWGHASIGSGPAIMTAISSEEAAEALDDMFPAGPSRLTGTLFMVTP
jgi:hypothetical protein